MALHPLAALVARATPLFALALTGCSLINHGAAPGDAGGGDAGAAAVVLDSGAVPPPAAPANVNEVGRFPDEVTMNDATAKIADPQIAARNAVPGGVLVATLRLGTPVTQVAKHEAFILCIFPDPKNPARNLEGWVAEQAFVAGPTVPSKATCPTGQTRLMFDEQDFCGRVCKNDSDCVSGQVCAGKANLFANGKLGADVTTCTMPSGGAAAGTSAGPKVVTGVQTPPLAGNTCPPMFVLSSDKLCHRDCTRGTGPCPAGSKCAHALGAAVCEAE